MPMYEFRCAGCGDVFEELASADEKVPCPKCGSADTERLMSACAHSAGGSSSGGDAGSSHSAGCGCSGCSGGHCSTCGH